MSIRRKGNRWEVRIRTGGGERVEQRLPSGATRRDAEALEVALRRRLVDSATGRIDHTLLEAFEAWQVDAQRLKSWQRDLRYRADVLRGHLGTTSLRQITDVADRVKKAGHDAGLSAAGINRYLAILKRIGSLAYKRGWIEHPIAARIELVSGERRRTVFVTPAEAKRLMLAADPRLRDLIQFAVLTGLRKSELLGLTPANVRGNALVLEETKSGEPRLVPMPPEAAAIAARRLPWNLSGPNVRKLWDQAREKAALPHVRWHDLRRTYGTWLLQQGADLASIRDLLGHSDVRTTSIYLASGRQDLANAVAKLPRLGEERGKKAAARKRRAA